MLEQDRRGFRLVRRNFLRLDEGLEGGGVHPDGPLPRANRPELAGLDQAADVVLARAQLVGDLSDFEQACVWIQRERQRQRVNRHVRDGELCLHSIA